jgi:threonine dehydratase
VIAGQGTVAVEIFNQLDFEKIDAVFVCVGGGGLISGIASYMKRLRPEIKIIGVETFDAHAMTTSLLEKKRVTLEQVGLFADGAAVRNVGEETFRLASSLVDEMVLVSTDEICAAIRDAFEDTRGILEPAGALSIAGAKKYILANGWEGKTIVTIASGANMNFDRLRFVAERADVGEKKEALISVIIPEEPSTFVKLCSVIHPRSITELSYRYGDEKKAHIFMSFSVHDRDAELPKVFEDLKKIGMDPTDASHNEMAKAHARYLVGGRKEVFKLNRFRTSDYSGLLSPKGLVPSRTFWTSSRIRCGTSRYSTTETMVEM